MFWNSMTDWEKEHIAAAFSFELNQVEDEGVRDRMMNEILVNITRIWPSMVSERPASPSTRRHARGPDAVSADASGPLREDAIKLYSPALSMDKAPPPPSLIGRKVAMLIGYGADAKRTPVLPGGASPTRHCWPRLIAPHGRTVAALGKPVNVNRAAPNAPSVVYDAVLVPSGIAAALAAAAAGAAFRP